MPNPAPREPHISIGLRLKENRERMGITQASLARALELSTVMICHHENGSVPIPTERLLEICRIFRRDPNYFLGWSSPPEKRGVCHARVSASNSPTT